MIILEYLLDATDAGMKCPPWVDDGGDWGSTDHTLIGVTRNNPEFHIPSTVKRLTAAELETRQVSIHTANPLTKRGETPNHEVQVGYLSRAQQHLSDHQKNATGHQLYAKDVQRDGDQGLLGWRTRCCCA